MDDSLRINGAHHHYHLILVLILRDHNNGLVGDKNGPHILSVMKKVVPYLSCLDCQSVLNFMLKDPISVPFRGVRIRSPNIIRAVDKREYL